MNQETVVERGVATEAIENGSVDEEVSATAGTDVSEMSTEEHSPSEPAAEVATLEVENVAPDEVDTTAEAEVATLEVESVAPDDVGTPAEAEVATLEAESVAPDDVDTPAEAVDGEVTEASADTPEEVQVDDDSNKRVVRILSVDQEVTGTVKRVTDFGAFVDIGVGRDGLIHVSELSVRRVGKVGDVLSQGQEITAWIKKLDRERNRISLTMISPGTKTIRDLEKDDIVEGTVTRLLPYGAFIDIGVGRDALLHVREMGESFIAKPEDVVQVGEKLEARIIELSRRKNRIDLSIKGLRPEPEPEAPPEAEAEAAPVPEEEEAQDPFADVEVLSPMEMAFKRAMEAEGINVDTRSRKKGKKSKRAQVRALQDEIIARTLSSSN